MPPSDVPPVAIRVLTGSPVDGSTSDATAEAANAIEPRRFRATIHQDSDRRCMQSQR